MKLTYNEIASLIVELNGDGKEFKGLLKQKLTMKVKVMLHRLNNVVQEEMKIFDELRRELFKKHGEEKDGTITIPPAKIAEFQPEFSELLDIEKDIELSSLWTTPLTLDDVEALETDEFYPTFIKILESK